MHGTTDLHIDVAVATPTAQEYINHAEHPSASEAGAAALLRRKAKIAHYRAAAPHLQDHGLLAFTMEATGRFDLKATDFLENLKGTRRAGDLITYFRTEVAVILATFNGKMIQEGRRQLYNRA